MNGKLEQGRAHAVGFDYSQIESDEMGKGKDLRNGKEEGRWKPGKWSPARARIELKHARRHSLGCIADFVSGDAAHVAHANVIADTNVALSKLGILEKYGADRLVELYPNG